MKIKKNIILHSEKQPSSVVERINRFQSQRSRAGRNANKVRTLSRWLSITTQCFYITSFEFMCLLECCKYKPRSSKMKMTHILPDVWLLIYVYKDFIGKKLLLISLTKIWSVMKQCTIIDNHHNWYVGTYVSIL